MDKKIRPFNPVIVSIGDTFVEGEKPTRQEIDLTKVSDKELEKLSHTYSEAYYEIIWRALTDSLED